MSVYRSRPSEIRVCKHCSTSFETRHKRTIYCGSSCRTLAYNARHDDDQGESDEETKENLSFSLQNIGVTAAGATVAAVGNYILNDKPAQKEIIAKLANIESVLGQLLQAGQYQIDAVNAVHQLVPGMKQLMFTEHQNRIEEKKKKQVEYVNSLRDKRSK